MSLTNTQTPEMSTKTLGIIVMSSFETTAIHICSDDKM